MSENKYPIGGYAPGNYNPIGCEHKLPNGFSAWSFQSEEQSNLGGQNKVSIHVCLLCGEINIGGYRPSKDEKHVNSFHETFHIYHPEAVDAIIKQANFFNEEAKWGRVSDKPAVGGYAPLPADDAVQNWFEENIDKECSASSAIYKFRQWLETLQHKPTGAISPILADIIRFKAGAAEYFMQHNYRELYGIIQAMIQLAEDGIKTSGPVWYTEKEMYNYLRQNNYSTYIANELAKDWAISFQGAYEKGRQHASQQPAGAVWVKGDYDRLYDQLKADVNCRIVCYVDYDGFSRNDGSAPCRDICTIKGNRMEFSARGIGYGGAESWFDEKDKKEALLKDCERLNVEWLDETPTTNNDHITAALQKFVSMHETGLLPNRFTYEEGKKALEGVGANNDTIEFAEWCDDNYYRKYGFWRHRGNHEHYTTADLHQLWQQSKSKV